MRMQHTSTRTPHTLHQWTRPNMHSAQRHARPPPFCYPQNIARHYKCPHANAQFTQRNSRYGQPMTCTRSTLSTRLRPSPSFTRTKQSATQPERQGRCRACKSTTDQSASTWVRHARTRPKHYSHRRDELKGKTVVESRPNPSSRMLRSRAHT